MKFHFFKKLTLFNDHRSPLTGDYGGAKKYSDVFSRKNKIRTSQVY